MKRAYWGTLIAMVCVVGSARADSIAVSPVIAVDATVSSDDGATKPVQQRRVAVAQKANAEADEQLQRANEQFARAKEAMDRAKEQMERAKPEMEQSLAYFNNGGFGAFNLSGKRGERALVIRTSEADGKALAGAEEDLNIMGRVLEKALAQSNEDEEHQAMGIRLITLNGPGSPKNLLIEGYGAIFMLNVNIPLVGPPTKGEENEDKEPANSSWDEAKRELYGQPRAGHPVAKSDYDPKLVEKLKMSLLAALKNASNIRSLKSDENVTLVVTSASGGKTVRYVDRLDKKLSSAPRANAFGSSSGGGAGGISGGGGFGGGGSAGGLPAGGFSWALAADSADGPVMTIRARKPDIDAFAKGKLTLEEFRNKATVLVY